MGVMKTNAAPSSSGALSDNGEAIDCCVREIYQKCEAQLPIDLLMSEQITPDGD